MFRPVPMASRVKIRAMHRIGVIVAIAGVLLLAQNQTPAPTTGTVRVTSRTPAQAPAREDDGRRPGAASTYTIVPNPNPSTTSPYAYRMDTRTGDSWVLLLESSGKYRWVRTEEGPRPDVQIIVNPRPKSARP